MKWHIVNKDSDENRELNLRVNGRNVATVWRTGTWHTWDHDGCGGENSRETFDQFIEWPFGSGVQEKIRDGDPDVLKAMAEAEASVIRQGFDKKIKKQK
jgi:hypothetical protein